MRTFVAYVLVLLALGIIMTAVKDMVTLTNYLEPEQFISMYGSDYLYALLLIVVGIRISP